jgi:hypothetical protein
MQGPSFCALRFEAFSSTPHYLLTARNGVIRVLGLDRSLSPPPGNTQIDQREFVGVDGADELLVVVPESTPRCCGFRERGSC